MDELPLRIPESSPPTRTQIPPEQPDASQKRRVTLAAGLSILWTIFTLLAQFSGALDTFEEPLLDWRQSLAAYPVKSSDQLQLALIAIDEIPSDKPWPWSRLEYTLALRGITDYAPQSVVFEMNLNDRDTEFTVFDDTFSHIVKRANTVIFASTLLARKNPAPLPSNLNTIPFHGDDRLVSRFGSANWPLATFAGKSPVGANNIETESDLRLRRLPLVFLLNDKMIPSLVLESAAQFLGADLSVSEVQVGRAIFLRRHDGKLLRTIPIDSEGRMRIRYQPGPVASWAARFDDILLYDDQLRHNMTPEHNLRDLLKRQVWFGRTDPDERKFLTAVGQRTRTEIELQAERNILDQDYVRPLPPMILATLYLLVGIVGAASLIRLGPVHAAAILFFIALFWFESSLLSFRVYNVILPLPSFAILLFGTYAVGFLASCWDIEPETDPRQLPLDL